MTNAQEDKIENQQVSRVDWKLLFLFNILPATNI